MIIPQPDEDNILMKVEIDRKKYGFTIKWVDPDHRVWLDEVFERVILEAYNDGYNKAKKEARQKVKEFKEFFDI
jgi:DNA-binding protein YbaB